MAKKIAVLLASDFEDSELTQPVEALRAAGHEVEILGSRSGESLEGKQGEASVTTDGAAKDSDPSTYDALLIPGGYSPDQLRTDEDVVDFVRRFASLGRPIAAVCHGPQLLIEAGVVAGKTMTSWPSVRTDLKNAGASVVDEEVCVDGRWITSRNPDDLPAFSRALLAQL